MSEPLVVQRIREFQVRIAAQEDAEFEEMAQRWLEIERTMETEINALAVEIEGMRQKGKPPTQGQIRQMERLQNLLAQTEDEIGRFGQEVAERIGREQSALAEQGWQDARTALQAAGADPALLAEFDRLPVAAVENMVGLTGDGSPLATYLQEMWPKAAAGMVRLLLQGVAEGWNPTRTAKAMRDGLGIGLQSALNTARTEQLRVYREATRAAYEQSGFVTRYKRIASKSLRTCIACLVADGRIYETRSAFEEHNQGRCNLVPIIDGMDEPTWESGLEWFGQQSAADQQTILGAEYYKALKAGSFTLDQLATRHEDPVWGASIRVTPLGELVGG